MAHAARFLSLQRLQLIRPTTQSRLLSQVVKGPEAIQAMLAKPTWSVKSLLDERDTKPAETITQKQLHHLLRLSALPLPGSQAEEDKMIKDLQSQLHFVRAIQEVDTEGVEPLQAIRDETEEAEAENMITMESLKEDLAKEEVVGVRGRIKRRKRTSPDKEPAEDWDPLAQAPGKHERFFVVDTEKD